VRAGSSSAVVFAGRRGDFKGFLDKMTVCPDPNIIAVDATTRFMADAGTGLPGPSSEC
jgi:hypothetical protein